MRDRSVFRSTLLGAGDGKGPELGFTLVELIVTMVVLGIIAAVAVPRFADRTAFDARGFYDGTLAALRYAQKSAIAQRRSVCVTFGAASVVLSVDTLFSDDGTCRSDLVAPSANEPYTVRAEGGVTFSSQPADFRFLPSGVATRGQVLSVNGLPTRSITIVAGTGYVQEN